MGHRLSFAETDQRINVTAFGAHQHANFLPSKRSPANPVQPSISRRVLLIEIAHLVTVRLSLHHKRIAPRCTTIHLIHWYEVRAIPPFRLFNTLGKPSPCRAPLGFGGSRDVSTCWVRRRDSRRWPNFHRPRAAGRGSLRLPQRGVFRRLQRKVHQKGEDAGDPDPRRWADVTNPAGFAVRLMVVNSRAIRCSVSWKTLMSRGQIRNPHRGGGPVRVRAIF